MKKIHTQSVAKNIILLISLTTLTLYNKQSIHAASNIQQIEDNNDSLLSDEDMKDIDRKGLPEVRPLEANGVPIQLMTDEDVKRFKDVNDAELDALDQDLGRFQKLMDIKHGEEQKNREHQQAEFDQMMKEEYDLLHYENEVYKVKKQEEKLNKLKKEREALKERKKISQQLKQASKEQDDFLPNKLKEKMAKYEKAMADLREKYPNLDLDSIQDCHKAPELKLNNGIAVSIKSGFIDYEKIGKKLAQQQLKKQKTLKKPYLRNRSYQGSNIPNNSNRNLPLRNDDLGIFYTFIQDVRANMADIHARHPIVSCCCCWLCIATIAGGTVLAGYFIARHTG